ncbi:30S ribosomal protein S9, partial [Brevibacterium casei]
MADTANATEVEELTEYTSETPADAGLGDQTAGGRGQSLTAPGNGVGRRKQAIARVRLIPGSGEWTINGRTLEEYFPNKLHQQLVNE